MRSDIYRLHAAISARVDGRDGFLHENLPAAAAIDKMDALCFFFLKHQTTLNIKYDCASATRDGIFYDNLLH